MLVGAIGLIVAIGLLNATGNKQPGQTIVSIGSNGSTTTSIIGANQCASSLPVTLTVRNALSGAVVNAPTVTVYQNQLQTETGTASSAGVYNAAAYTTGTQLTVKINGGSGVTMATEWLPFTVPPISCGTNASTNNVNIYAVLLGSWSLTATGNGGTTFATGGKNYFSQFPGGLTGTEQINLQISETTANAGYKSSYDILNAVNTNFIIQFKDTATLLTLTGLPRIVTSGTTRYWPTACSDGIASGIGYGTTNPAGAFLVTQTGNTVDSQGANSPAQQAPDSTCTGSLSQQTLGLNTYGGTNNIIFGVAAGGLASGGTEAIVVQPYVYASIAYFVANTNYGPNSATQGSSFTFNLYNA